MIIFLLYVLVFLLTLFGVEMFRRWSRHLNLLDIPNERSSHIMPTPRGGGLIIGIVCLSAFFGYCSIFQINYYWSYFIGAIIIILISWLDDLFSISVIWRFVCQGLVAALIVWDLGYWENIYLPYDGAINLGQFGFFFTLLWIVWLTNAYNFMDGIDGIAATQAITAGIGWMIVCLMLEMPTTAFYGGVIASAGLGFLILNWQPAKIFMGDAGSAFFGFTFAVLPLLTAKEAVPKAETIVLLPLLAVLINWFFIFDTVFTLCKRILKKEKIWKAHRSHLYQQMVIFGYEHRTVSLLYGTLSVLTISMALLRLTIGSGFDLILFFVTILETIGLIIFIGFMGRKISVSER